MSPVCGLLSDYFDHLLSQAGRVALHVCSVDVSSILTVPWRLIISGFAKPNFTQIFRIGRQVSVVGQSGIRFAIAQGTLPS